MGILEVLGLVVVALLGFLGIEMGKRKKAESELLVSETKIEDAKLETKQEFSQAKTEELKAQIAATDAVNHEELKTPEDVTKFWNKKE